MLRLIAVLGLAVPLVWSQTIAIRAGQLFDPESGTKLANQVVLVPDERIMDVRRSAFGSVTPRPLASYLFCHHAPHTPTRLRPAVGHQPTRNNL